MKGFLRFNGIRKSTAAFAILAIFTLGLGAGAAMADDIGGEDVVVPPPAPAPAPPPPPPPPPPVAEQNFKLYLTGITGYSWGKGEASGHNNCCAPWFPRPDRKNRGQDWDGTVFGGGALGIDADLGPIGMRLEAEGQAARGYDMKTKGPVFDDYALEFKTPNSPYLISSNSWAVFFNLFMDLPITETFDFYMGGGVGFGVHDFRVRQKAMNIGDTSHDDLNFAWQVGGGFAYDVADWLTLDLGYRYVDFGKMDVNLPQPVGGDYQMHLVSHDMILGVRINYFSF